MSNNLEDRRLIKLPPDLITTLGEVSARYGQIEHLLTMTIHRTAGISYDDAVTEVEKLRHRENVRRRAKRSFKTWAAEKFGETEGKARAESFNDLVKIWKGLHDRRDDVIHCCWSVGKEDQQLSGTRRGELLTTEGRPFGIKDVEVLGTDLRQFVIHLNMATRPTSSVLGPESEIAAMPARFVPGWVIPAEWETTATAAALFTTTVRIAEPSDD